MNEAALAVDRFYAETCASIRATDEISFKLMGLVPFVSGAALLTFFLKESRGLSRLLLTRPVREYGFHGRKNFVIECHVYSHSI
jgi:hypothetical protein